MPLYALPVERLVLTSEAAGSLAQDRRHRGNLPFVRDSMIWSVICWRIPFGLNIVVSLNR